MARSQAFETLAIHAGQEPDPSTGAVMTPIYQTSTYRQEAVGEHLGYEYSRTGNPTRAALEACLAALEEGRYAYAFASGMAATDAVLRLLQPGDHVLAVNDLYGGTYRIFQQVYARWGLQISYASGREPEEVLKGVQENTRLVWIETPTNPLLTLYDLRAIRDGLDRLANPPLLCVDNTFATPFLQRPLALGADIVVHSTTKYLGGHSDVIGGAAVARDEALADQLAFLQNAAGAVPGPLDCFLVLRGLKTLAVRMERHAENAMRLARFLEDHEAVAQVYYPFLESNPQFELAQRQMRNGGGMISFIPHGGSGAARRIAESLHLFTLAESLGGVESLVEIPAAMTHASAADSPLEVDPALIRLSVGLEAAQDLLDDLEAALG